jgi:hypothetical protein
MRNEEFEEEKRIIERRAGTYQHVSWDAGFWCTRKVASVVHRCSNLLALFSYCSQLCRMLSGKCRDMSIRDLVIELQPNRCMSTSVFTACGIPYVKQLDRLGSMRRAETESLTLFQISYCSCSPVATGGKCIWIRRRTRRNRKSRSICALVSQLASLPRASFIRVFFALCADPPFVSVRCASAVEPIHHKLSIEVFCLPGPALEYELMPTLRRVSFKVSSDYQVCAFKFAREQTALNSANFIRSISCLFFSSLVKAGVTQSESFSLPFSLEDARDVHRLSVVSLRMVSSHDTSNTGVRLANASAFPAHVDLCLLCCCCCCCCCRVSST